MSFTESITTCFQKYADFNGRARRSEYWYFAIFMSLIEALAAVLFSTVLPATIMIGSTSINPVCLVMALLVLPRLAVSIRRLHDIGKSGWFFFINFIPVIGQIIFFIWCIKDSEPRANKFGPNPKDFRMTMNLQNA